MSRTTDDIGGLTLLASLTNLRLFQGLCNVFKRFVPYFARIVSQLNQRLKNKQSNLFSRLNCEEIHAMDTLKNTFTSPPMQALAYCGGHITLDTDSRNVQIGSVFLQEKPDDTNHPLVAGHV